MIAYTPKPCQVIRPVALEFPEDMLEHTLLPFVREVDGEIKYWDVSPTGDHYTDYLVGERYAMELLAYVSRRKMAASIIFLLIMIEMPRDEDMTDIERGFLGAIGDFIGELGTKAFGGGVKA